MSSETQRPEPFNPLSESILARTIRRELEAQPLCGLMPPRFMGAGLYALYYLGNHPLYRGINDAALNCPVYVGRALAGSSRMGKRMEGRTTEKLWKRIEQHAKSIDAAENIMLSDFRLRYLVMSDVMIVLGEAGLLQEYAPVWNVFLDGLGSNVHGEGRPNQKLSKWETVHPGRGRTARPHQQTREAIETRAREIIQATLNSLNGGETSPRS